MSSSESGAAASESEGELHSEPNSPTPPSRDRRSRFVGWFVPSLGFREREKPSLSTSSSTCLSRYYRQRFGSHSPEDYLNLRFSKMNDRLSKEEIKHVLEKELKRMEPFEVKVVRDPESEDRLAYVNFRKSNCAKTVRRTLIPRLQQKLGESVLIDPAGVLRDQEGKFIPDRFNRAQMTTEVMDRQHVHHHSSGGAHSSHRNFSNLNQDDNLATRTLFVGNLPGDVRHVELMRVFGQFGSVEDIDVKLVSEGNAAYAFIVFHSLDSAIDALHAQHNHPIRAHHAAKCQIGYGKSQVSSLLWVGRLGAWASKDMLMREFDRYGVVEMVDFTPGTHHAYVRFADPNSAKDACLALRNFPLDGRHKIVVDYANAAKKSVELRKRPPSRSPEPSRSRKTPRKESEGSVGSSEPEIKSYSSLNEKMPSTWKGFLRLKKTDYNIKLHRVLGREHLIQDLLRNEEGTALRIKIDQRLPRESVFLEKLAAAEPDQLVFMVGAETSLSFTPLIQYLDEKRAVGMTSVPGATVFVLPFCSLTAKIVKRYLPRISVLSADANYLLLILQAT